MFFQAGTKYYGASVTFYELHKGELSEEQKEILEVYGSHRWWIDR